MMSGTSESTARNLTQPLLTALESVLADAQKPVSLHQPQFVGREWEYVKDCIDTGWVSSVGCYVTRFEQMLAEFTGAPYAVATVNGTAALHICLMLAGVEASDEVIVPALTFIATANAVCYCGAIPHFADSSLLTLGLDPEKLNTHLRESTVIRGGEAFNRISGRRIRAVVPMHTFGHPVDMEPLLEVAERYGLAVVEDAAESIGSYYKGRHTGIFGKINSLSFNGNKVITTGGGGAILTSDPELGRLAKHLTTTARMPHAWSFLHDQIGYNYRLPNLNAAMGCAQMELLPRFLAKKRALAHRYHEALSGIAGLSVFIEPAFARSNYWLNALILDADFAEERDSLLEATNAQGYQTRPVWTLMHRLPMFKSCPRMALDTSELLERRLINLPSSACL
jgi:perosamine synthetase